MSLDCVNFVETDYVQMLPLIKNRGASSFKSEIKFGKNSSLLKVRPRGFVNKFLDFGDGFHQDYSNEFTNNHAVNLGFSILNNLNGWFEYTDSSFADAALKTSYQNLVLQDLE